MSTILTNVLERTRKEILRGTDPSFINHKANARKLPALNITGARYQGLSKKTYQKYRQYQAIFETNSASFPGEKSHTQKILLMDMMRMLKATDSKMSLKEKVLYAVNDGDLLIGCSCEAFLFWGYAWITTKMKIVHPDYAEKRPPKVRNPQHRGIICKHIDLVLKVLPFNVSNIIKDLKEEGWE